MQSSITCREAFEARPPKNHSSSGSDRRANDWQRAGNMNSQDIPPLPPRSNESMRYVVEGTKIFEFKGLTGKY